MTKDDDQDLASLRRAFATHSHPLPEPAPCPAPEKIWDAVHGKLPADEVREIVSHTAACAACAEDWRLAHALQTQEAEVAAVPAPLRFAPRTQRLRNWGLAAAAALAMAFFGVQYFQSQQPTTAPEYRGGERTVSSLVAEGKPLPRERFVLRWSAPAPGTAYDVQVSTEDLRVVANAEGLKTTEYQVPASALADLPAGSRLFWKVEADLPAGDHISSKTFVTPVQ
jgi:anti-sigma factor RsiW